MTRTVGHPWIVNPDHIRDWVDEPLYVAIFLYNHVDTTAPLVKQLLSERETYRSFEDILLFDNGSDEPETLSWLDELNDPHVRVIRRPDSGLYEMWNEAIDLSLSLSEGRRASTAILNNDILFTTPDALGTMHRVLRSSEALLATTPHLIEHGESDPDGPIVPSWHVHGYCFVTKSEAYPRRSLLSFDEAYRLFYADIVWNFRAVDQGWLFGTCQNVGCDHKTSTSVKDEQSPRRSLVEQWKEQDRILYEREFPSDYCLRLINETMKLLDPWIESGHVLRSEKGFVNQVSI